MSLSQPLSQPLPLPAAHPAAQPAGLVPVVQDCAELCNTQPPEITDTQRRAIFLILAGKSDAAVAYAVGAHRNTVRNWRTKCPRFQLELHNARQQLWSAELDTLRALLLQGLKEIRRQLKSKCNEDTRFRAARALLPLVGNPRLAPRPGFVSADPSPPAALHPLDAPHLAPAE